MLSVSGKNWEETSISKRIIDKLKIDHNLSELTAKLIIDRGFTYHEIYSIKKSIKLLNPFLNNSDFLKCNSLLKKNIDKLSNDFKMGWRKKMVI